MMIQTTPNDGARTSPPRLLYVSDVPVEATFAGCILLHRLLEGYPADKLLILEGNLFKSKSDRRLPGVRYESFRVGWSRLLRTRFARPYATWLALSARSRARRLTPLIGDFAPEAVLSVTNYMSWITAAECASRRKLPLHLILHDETVETPIVAKFVKPHMHRVFGRVYRAAASRMCVSPFMAEEYQRRYGAPGTVLYPNRGWKSEVFAGPSERLLQTARNGGLVVAFGGTVNSPGIRVLLQLVAEALQPFGGSLRVFGPVDSERARADGLKASNVLFRGSLAPEEFKLALRQEADVLLTPVDFSPEGALNVFLNFPSKLADYTAVGLPLLIVGPEQSGAVRWARENAPVAELVVREDRADIRKALERLRSPEHRLMLAREALAKGNQFFSPEAARQEFFSRIQAPCFSNG
jgi:glycosyltransferase involved in cell wall biosynthesis